MKASFNDLINSDVPVLVDFTASWCGPCKAMAPVLQAVAEKVGEQARIVKIDVDQNPALAQQMRIQSVPTFMIFKNGKKLWGESGMQSAAKLEQL